MGANGLVDTLETSTESGTINYTSTYSAYAINDAINACINSVIYRISTVGRSVVDGTAFCRSF